MWFDAASTALNLLLNAAQAINGSGRISITVSHDEEWCILDTRDMGPGVASELRDGVFEPFFTTKSRGGGLGLPIAQRTAELPPSVRQNFTAAA